MTEFLLQLPNHFHHLALDQQQQNQVFLIWLIQYLFAHAMPYMRGTASIAEWLESAIYLFHGFDLERIEGKNVNCSALIMSYQDFRDEYLNLFILHAQEPQKAITMGAT